MCLVEIKATHKKDLQETIIRSTDSRGSKRSLTQSIQNQPFKIKYIFICHKLHIQQVWHCSEMLTYKPLTNNSVLRKNKAKKLNQKKTDMEGLSFRQVTLVQVACLEGVRQATFVNYGTMEVCLNHVVLQTRSGTWLKMSVKTYLPAHAWSTRPGTPSSCEC